jgi:hypothetical protein
MRDFHATPELCPPPAASADIARRRLLTAVAAAPVIAVAFPVSAERCSDDDAPLFNMSRHIFELEAEIDRLVEEGERRAETLPPIEWVPEELAEHRITGDHDAARRVSKDDIDESNKQDAPKLADYKITQTDDGVTLIQVHTTVRRPSDDPEIQAWRTRCSARRALYDQKEMARRDAWEALGMDDLEDKQEELQEKCYALIDEITKYQPKTIVGVLEKMRIFKHEYSEIFSGPPNSISYTSHIFLSALADFERLASR